jgi:hypothetical protein
MFDLCPLSFSLKKKTKENLHNLKTRMLKKYRNHERRRRRSRVCL